MSFSYFFNLQIKRFTEKQADSIEHVEFYNKILITGSSMQVLINLIFCVCIVSDPISVVYSIIRTRNPIRAAWPSGTWETYPKYY